MFKKVLIALGVLISTASWSYSQGIITGKVTEPDGKTPVPFATVVVDLGGKQVGATATDFDGKYMIKGIPGGTYNVKATFAGCQTVTQTDFLIKEDGFSYCDFKLNCSEGIQLEEVVIKHERPLIDRGGGLTETRSAEDIAKMPGRSVSGIASQMAGVLSVDGGMGSVRGSRTDGTVTYVDGVRVRGSIGLPKSAIQSISLIMSGVPAKYGEAAGGALVVTSKGPSRDFGGSAEIVGSIDGYNNFLGNFTLNGPLIKSKNKADETSLLGFFVSLDAAYNTDGSPAQGGTFRMKDNVRERVVNKPLFAEDDNPYVMLQTAEYLRRSDFEKIRVRKNAESYSINGAGKIDVKTTKNTNLTFGGSYAWSKGRSWSLTSALMNDKHNGYSESSQYRVYGRFIHRIPTKDTSSLIKNMFYQLQVDYTKINSKSYDGTHKDKIFEYGYLGKFTTKSTKGYDQVDETVINGKTFNNIALLNDLKYDTLVEFIAANTNPELATYTQNYYNQYLNGEAYEKLGSAMVANKESLSLGSALLNGNSAASIYSLFTAPGVITSGYGFSEQDQIGFSANGSFDLKGHGIEFGFQYEQQTIRSYTSPTTGIWSLMRDLANTHIKQLDVDNPLYVYYNQATGERKTYDSYRGSSFGDWSFQDTIEYNRLYDAETQTQFDKSLREKLGLAVDGTDYIDIDSYDPSTFSIDMFSAEDLLNFAGNAYVSYYGYDHTGKKNSNKVSVSKFLNGLDSKGNHTYEIGARKPIYMAGYIQDQFSFDDIVFNVGVRVDRFDANQPVLKDPYLLSAARTVSEVSEINGVAVNHPSNISKGAVVYVDDLTAPTSVVGYRSGSTWYDKYGTEVSDPTATLSEGTSTNSITPYLVEAPEAGGTKMHENAFKSYTPQVTVMPRVAFSFPVSTKALFVANYDVITKRPTSGLTFNPLSYYLLEANPTTWINNPDMKPEKSVNYELGFQQELNAKSALKISAYYSEKRDMVQVYRFTGAYPSSYYSYNNIDFGTTQGFSIQYDLRQSQNIRLTASYTLQFAKGTGSSATSGSSLITSGQPNLRTLTPLDFDQRHAIKANVDLRFGDGKNYNGPKTVKKVVKDGKEVSKEIRWLENTGVNITFAGGSGLPYSRVTSPTSFVVSTSSLLQGGINTSNLPWQFWVDLRLDREFELTLKKDANNPKKSKKGSLIVYIEVKNIFDFENVTGIYAYTGTADDDGFLSAAEYQTQIYSSVDPQAFIDYYTMRMQNPYNYSTPRMINLGVQFGF